MSLHVATVRRGLPTANPWVRCSARMRKRWPKIYQATSPQGSWRRCLLRPGASRRPIGCGSCRPEGPCWWGSWRQPQSWPRFSFPSSWAAVTAFARAARRRMKPTSIASQCESPGARPLVFQNDLGETVIWVVPEAADAFGGSGRTPSNESSKMGLLAVGGLAVVWAAAVTPARAEITLKVSVQEMRLKKKPSAGGDEEPGFDDAQHGEEGPRRANPGASRLARRRSCSCRMATR